MVIGLVCGLNFVLTPLLYTCVSYSKLDIHKLNRIMSVKDSYPFNKVTEDYSQVNGVLI